MSLQSQPSGGLVERSSAWALAAALVLTVPVAAVGALIVLLGAADAAGEDASDTEALVIVAILGVAAIGAWAGLVWTLIQWWREGYAHVWGLPLTILVGVLMAPFLLLLFIPRVRLAIWPQKRQAEQSAPLL
jgi:cation transport ATPase